MYIKKQKKLLIAIIVILIVALAIRLIYKNKNPFPPQINSSIQINPNIFESGKKIAKINTNIFKEASGLVMSRNNPNFFWTHNDSGGKPEIYLFDKKGEHWATYTIPVKLRDWEEIKITQQDGKNYIYVADIGDNFGKYHIKKIYKFLEPSLKDIQKGYKSNVENIETFQFQYPNNEKRDSEAFLIDNLTQDIYIITKREKPKVKVFRWKFPQSKNKVEILDFVTDIPCFKVTSADISTDGKEIIIKDYDNVYYWKRENNENLSEVFKKPPIRLPYISEPQGEGLAIDVNNQGYYTLSESQKPKNEQYLIFYKRK
jgi:hypothetical protein